MKHIVFENDGTIVFVNNLFGIFPDGHYDILFAWPASGRGHRITCKSEELRSELLSYLSSFLVSRNDVVFDVTMKYLDE